MALDEPTAGMDVEGPPRLLVGHPPRRRRRAAPSSSRRTTSKRPTPTRTGSSCCARAGSWPTGRPPRSATSPAAGRSGPAWPDADEATLSRLPGVRSVEIRGDRVLIQTMDSDAVARYLLTVDDRPRRRDRGPQPGGRVPRPDLATSRSPRRERRGDAATRVRSQPRRRDAARRVQPDVPRDRDPPAPAQPSDGRRDRSSCRSSCSCCSAGTRAWRR